MTNLARVTTAVALLALSAACSRPADRGAATSVSGDSWVAETAIRDLERAVFAAEAAGDVERWLSYCTEDAMLLPPGEHPVAGAQAIRAWAIGAGHERA